MATNGSTNCLGTSQDDPDQDCQVKPKPLLLKLLHFAGARSETFTIKEVMHYLGQYIMAKQLYDERQQHIVHCSDDLLSHLFGVQSFSIKEPRTLYAMLSKNLISVGHEDSIDDLNLGKITNQLGGEDCLMTVIPNDGNACTSCNVSCSPATGRRSNCSDSDNDASPDEQFHTRRRKRHRSDSISLHWDDLSLCLISKLRREHGNSESSDSPSHLDYWKCSKCEELNPPLPRHCHRCWSVRQDWLPDKSKLQFDKMQDEGIDVPDCKKPPLESKKSNCSDLISEASQCSESQETECSEPSTSGSFNCCSQEFEKESTGKGEKGELSTLGPLEACVICQARPKNGCIVHGRTGHLLACYTCAKKLKKRNKPCPLCREPIQLVVLTYFS
ncbi:E3 ubiquitin-protein ligase Mdm2 isoform X2 [Hemiscyllium ocellatum]|uniref:E3 ubiquitin-protein ligase Mdm2 isoform X2 n=1 Tax=Hemiscyllium ocellatum TaxID=170820 RepID=UPI002966B08A|nr:E3 ubiquitin-protein ligase Mdm2 isoform X2 [Hemiscyllium ocellatum]